MGLRKSMDDQFWPITVYDGKMVCVPLKGGNSYPDAARKPVTSTLALRLPLAASTSGKM
jgi:chromosome transmission fidelity protein 4